MKQLIVSILFVPGLMLAGPKPTPVPTPPPDVPSRAALLATVDHIAALAKDAIAQLDKEKAEHKIVEQALTDATAKNTYLQNEINKQTEKCNATIDKLNKAEKSLWWYRIHWWGAWVMLGLGILACLVFAFLKFTGRLALVTAPIIAKVP